ALGKPAWVLVPAVPEWRYLQTGNAMPWYPSVRLFRQQRDGWIPVIMGIAQRVSMLKL
ncbi:MAG: glycosyl transferase family 8, partial [Betaproteobacteria bacterium]|nr:glycosyl transferase family 8 [Betaproteobacteria bacterium]